MIVRKLDKKHDWCFGAGLGSYQTKSEAIAQCVKTAILSIYQDWFLDLEHGVEWKRFFTKNPDLQTFEWELKQTILNVEGVVQITEFDITVDPETRRGTVEVTYLDIYNNLESVYANHR